MNIFDQIRHSQLIIVDDEYYHFTVFEDDDDPRSFRLSLDKVGANYKNSFHFTYDDLINAVPPHFIQENGFIVNKVLLEFFTLVPTSELSGLYSDVV